MNAIPQAGSGTGSRKSTPISPHFYCGGDHSNKCTRYLADCHRPLWAPKWKIITTTSLSLPIKDTNLC